MKSRGFTITEAMIAIAMAAILLAVGVPSLQTFLQNNRQDARVNDLISFIKYARTEAVNMGQMVTICGTTDMITCNAESWERGALMYLGQPEAAGFTPDDKLVRVLPGQNRDYKVTLRSQTDGDEQMFISYQPSGRLVEGDAGSLVLCDERGETHARGLNINSIGQIMTAVDEDGDGVVDVKLPNNLSCSTAQ